MRVPQNVEIGVDRAIASFGVASEGFPRHTSDAFRLIVAAVTLAYVAI